MVFSQMRKSGNFFIILIKTINIIILISFIFSSLPENYTFADTLARPIISATAIRHPLLKQDGGVVKLDLIDLAKYCRRVAEKEIESNGADYDDNEATTITVLKNTINYKLIGNSLRDTLIPVLKYYDLEIYTL